MTVRIYFQTSRYSVSQIVICDPGVNFFVGWGLSFGLNKFSAENIQYPKIIYYIWNNLIIR